MADDNKKFVFRAEEAESYAVPARVAVGAHLSGKQQYDRAYERSINENEAFWAEKAAELITFFQPYTQVSSGSFIEGDIAWFTNGTLNVSYNCLDRHLAKRGDQIAIIWEGDEVDQIRRITYREAHREVCRLANVLISAGVRKGDTVAIYLPNCPEAAYAMLACARIGAPHSVIFAGFSADSLADRIVDASSKVLLTADQFKRGGRTVQLKTIADEALQRCPSITHCFVLRRTPETEKVPMVEGRDFWMGEAMSNARPYCPAVPLDSEDPLFLLYTSGSTGRPKGMVHTQAGYLLYTALTHKLSFDYQEGDVYACVADVGWITGHSYIVYGPLCNGATTLMFESTPLYPDAGRYWDMVQRHKINQFYTAPTAIRAVQKFGNEFVDKYDLSTLRVLGTVGEPINPEAWRWYYEVVGKKQCSIVDTFWQTESGGHMLTPLPGCTPQKPGAATTCALGMKMSLVDGKTGEVIEGNGKQGVLVASVPWPSIARTIWGDHQRYLNTYMRPFPGHYLTGDRANRDNDGYYWIGGRVDDVINVSGHRLGTAEIEAALTTADEVAEAAVIAIPHEIKGQALFAYVILGEGVKNSDDLPKQLRLTVRKLIGPFAQPDTVVVVPGLPKTRSGKIMRRLLRKIASKESKPEQLGDLSTLADASIVDKLIEIVNKNTK